MNRVFDAYARYSSHLIRHQNYRGREMRKEENENEAGGNKKYLISRAVTTLSQPLLVASTMCGSRRVPMVRKSARLFSSAT